MELEEEIETMEDTLYWGGFSEFDLNLLVGVLQFCDTVRSNVIMPDKKATFVDELEDEFSMIWASENELPCIYRVWTFNDCKGHIGKILDSYLTKIGKLIAYKTIDVIMTSNSTEEAKAKRAMMIALDDTFSFDLAGKRIKQIAEVIIPIEE